MFKTKLTLPLLLLLRNRKLVISILTPASLAIVGLLKGCRDVSYRTEWMYLGVQNELERANQRLSFFIPFC